MPERNIEKEIIEAASDFVAITTADGHLLYLNKSAKKVYGISADDDIKKLTIDDFHPEWALEIIHKESIPTAIRDGIWMGDIAIKNKNGKEIPFSQIIVSHKDSNGEVEFFSTIMRDITQLKQAEKERDRAEEMLKESYKKAILELSVPVVKVWDRILMVPLIGTLDSERTRLIMETLLSEIEENQAKVAILDISGIPIVDSLVARHLISTVSAAKLMGTECIVTGIKAKISQTMIQLGIDLSGIITKATLADGIKIALEITGMKVVGK